MEAPWSLARLQAAAWFTLTPGKLRYKPNVLEKSGDWNVYFGRWLSKAFVYTSPLAVGILYRCGYFDDATLRYRVNTFVLSCSLAALATRCAGRLCSAEYRQFTRAALDYQFETNEEHRAGLRRLLGTIDYDVSAWPIVDYEFKGAPLDALLEPTKDYSEGGPVLSFVHWAIAHTIGITMTFPGLLSRMLFSPGYGPLVTGRRLWLNSDARRLGLKSRDGDLIDAMFIDRRRYGEAPHKLLITFSGNCDFYETGTAEVVRMMRGSVQNMSILSFNSPGFACSTGAPWPSRIASAADVVMEFAREQLRFAPADTVLYAWSIGGFGATYAAMQEPQPSAVILDACFDDIVPLARSVFRGAPNWMRSFVRPIARKYLDMPVARQLMRYRGAIRIVRRAHDEIIHTSDDLSNRKELLRQNRANWLVAALLQQRYSNLFISDAVNETPDDIGSWSFEKLLSDSAAGLCVQKYLSEKHNVKRYEYVNKVCEASDAVVPHWNEDKTSVDGFECSLDELSAATDADRCALAVCLCAMHLKTTAQGHNEYPHSICFDPPPQVPCVPRSARDA